MQKYHIFSDELDKIQIHCEQYNLMVIDIFDYPIASFIVIYTNELNARKLLLKFKVIIQKTSPEIKEEQEKKKEKEKDKALFH